MRSTKLFVIKKNGTFRPVSLKKRTESFTDFRKSNISFPLTCKQIEPSYFFDVFSNVFWKAHGIENGTTLKHSGNLRNFCCADCKHWNPALFSLSGLPLIDLISNFDHGRWVDRAVGPWNRDTKRDQPALQYTSIFAKFHAFSSSINVIGGRQSKRLSSSIFTPSTALNIGDNIFQKSDRISFLRPIGKDGIVCDGLLGENVSNKSKSTLIIFFDTNYSYFRLILIN